MEDIVQLHISHENLEWTKKQPRSVYFPYINGLGIKPSIKIIDKFLFSR